MKRKIFLILALIGAGFFCVQKGEVKAANSPAIIISEVKYGEEGAADNEFIEFYNATGEEINLVGFSLKKKTSSGSESSLVSSSKFIGAISAYGYFLISPLAYKEAIRADISYSGTTYYIAANNTIILYDQNGIVIDKVGYGSASDFETVAAADPGNNKSIARKITAGIMQDTDNNAADFEIKAVPGPQNTSSQKLIPENIENNNLNQDATTTPPINPPISSFEEGFFHLGDIVINEFVSDPADGEEEWVELYNTSDKAVNLSSWTIEEGSGGKTKLEGEVGISGEERFFIIQKISGNLNNKGDVIILRDADGSLIDQVAYGEWNDGDLGNNAPFAQDPNSVARKFDGQNSYNNANDFTLTTTLTKGKSNVIKEVAEGEGGAEEEMANYDYSGDIIISEIFPNPKGNDTDEEFIELHNQGSKDVNLRSWSLSDDSGKRYEITPQVPLSKGGGGGIIKAGGYLAIYRSESKIVLNNTNDSVKLYQPFKDEPLQAVKYEKAVEGWSFNAQIGTDSGQISHGYTDYKFVWSEIVTPGKVNEIKTINHSPVIDFDCPEEVLVGAAVIFDSSDTFDEDGDKLSYAWDFGDGVKNNIPSPEHTFLKKGVYRVELTVGDGKNEVKKEKIVKAVSEISPSPLLPRIDARGRLQEGGLGSQNVIINEFLPSPEGSDDEGEWVELYNQGQDEVNFLGWSLDDSEGGSKPYKFLSDFWLGPGLFYVVERSESRLALNNSGDSVRLFNDLDELVDEIEYGSATEGVAYARNQNGQWVWTNVLTPGDENIIEEAKLPIESSSKSKGAKKYKGVVVTTLDKVKEFEAGDLVKVNGIVAVKPGIFGVQYFYMVGSPGIQVYNYKKEFPELKVGDYVEVSGELSVANGEMRLKTKDREDIKVLEHKDEPSPEEISCDKLSDDNVGQLVRLAGEITEKKGAVIYLDDGLGEAEVYIKKNTGINTSDFSEGEAIAATGIVSRSSTGLRILPRSPDDIKRENDTGEVQVLGASSESDEWVIGGRKRILKYLLIIAAGVVLVLGGVWYKKKFKAKNSSPL